MRVLKMSARRWLALGVVAAAGAVAGGAAAQADYPSKAVRIIAPFPAGSGPDANAREIAAELTKILGQTFFVENRPGASNIIGTEVAAKAPADGYSLYIGTTSSLSVVPHLYAKLPFNAEKDFAPVSLLGVLNTGLIATPGVEAKDARALIAGLKARPDSLTVATAGIGSYSHLSAVWFNNAAGVKTNLVPYNSTSPYTDLIAGQVQAMFDGLPAAAGSIRAGRLKLLAITGSKRHPSFPDVPTFAEVGLPDYAPIAWQGILAPAGTPKPILEKLSAAMLKACQSEELARKWREYGGELRCDTPAEFAAFIHADRQMWGRVIRQANIKLD
ncbi:tripartite-type tricarboxylate transporter receptor subunit TctC [Variovorax boronicumulans]|uniref:Bug family tripartite tricarboxylate transporter substrate binding protein n=1 Tax=Variovorax boronicumulans TaxID=436515 RepID=UPI002785775E|nr:tripartite tricarboxylate transporter substrate binding protein [Variovorax boronicumulans]MDQ0073403.1 tripartite-type tricarboxylate transporter receptor subunit TctC [Variovorax boronicumulans]